MSPLTESLVERIRREGPLRFSEFMTTALYHEEFGYYRRGRVTFGADGDFFTASQLQPVFGRLIRRFIESLGWHAERSEPWSVVELGAGQGLMAEAFAGLDYVGVEWGRDTMPAAFRGVVFSNEFFDALPVDLFVQTSEGRHEQRVNWDGWRFVWTVDSAKGSIEETHTEARRWLDRIDAAMKEGDVVTIDYGYLGQERMKREAGTLMSYRRHRTIEDVLLHPGEQDITAHVDFTELKEYGAGLGWSVEMEGSIADLVLRAGQHDEFASALAGVNAQEAMKHRLQLKTLLYGMGPAYRVLVQRKRG